LSFDPKRTEVYRRAEKLAEQNWRGMNDAQKAETRKLMNINDMNIPGYSFYGKPVIRALVSTRMSGIECVCGFSAVVLNEGRCPKCNHIITGSN